MVDSEQFGRNIELDVKTPLQFEEKELNNMNIGSQPRVDENSFHSDGESSGNNMEQSPNVRRLHLFRQKQQNVIVIISLVVSLIAIVLALYAIIQYKEAVNELRIARESRGKICLPCEQDDIMIKSWKSDGRSDECCAKLEEVISMLKRMIVTKAAKLVDEGVATQISKLGGKDLALKTSAHLVIDKKNITGKIIKWRKFGPNTHIQDGITIDSEGRIKVPRTGFYYVYSQLTLHEAGNVYEIPTIRHSIMTQTEHGQPEEILQNANQKWKGLNDRNYLYQTSFVSGVVFLPADSYITVNYEQPIYVRQTGSASYFGFFMI